MNQINHWAHHISKSIVFGTAAVLFVLLLHFSTLLRYPEPHVDEMWLISRAWAFIQSGHPFGALDSGPVMQFDGYWIVNQWLISLLQSIALRFSPIPALLPVRILALLLGIGLLGANYWIVLNLLGHRPAIVSTLLLALSRAFFYSAHMARYDILAAFLGYLALALIIYKNRHAFIYSILGGFILGMAVETHLNSLIFIPAAGVVYLIEYGWRFLKSAACWGFGTGLAGGLVYYLALHVWPYPDTYSKVNALLFGSSHVPPILTFNFRVILNGFGEGFLLLVTGVFSMVLLGLLAIPRLVRTGSKTALQILGVNLALYVGASLLIPHKTAHYAVLLTPAFLWMVTFLLWEWQKHTWQGKISDYFYSILILSTLLGALIFNFLQLIPDNYEKYQKAQTTVNAALNPGDVIIGNQWFWLGLYDHRYYSWQVLAIQSRFYPGSNFEDALEFYHPDILIIDSALDALISDDVPPESFWYYQHLPRKALYGYLQVHAQLIKTIPTDLYGNIRVYRFLWR